MHALSTRAFEIIKDCTMCPRNCHVDRTRGEVGFCRVGEKAVLASAGPHLGEERPLVGHGGSGTIFFSGCNLHCVFCQNFDISQLHSGREVDAHDIASIMLGLQSRGCENINFVTPSHVTHQVIESILQAREDGLTIPVVYNCGGYEAMPTLKLLDGLVDIYMPDIKFLDSKASGRYSKAPDYPDIVRVAVKEMHGQVGDLVVRDGVATRGLLIRHLVMPGMTSDSKRIIDFISTELSANSYINVMDQYRSAFQASRFQEINRCLHRSEFEEVYEYANKRGLRLAD